MLTFEDLEKDYDFFRVPQYEILLGSPETAVSSLSALSVEDFPVLSISVSQSVGPASSAQVSFACPYDFENSKFESDIYSKLEAGSKIAIKLGYSKPETVFVGAVGSINTNFSASGITAGITCYDAKIALFHNKTWKSFPKQSTIQTVIEELLKPCKKYGDLNIEGLKYDEAVSEGQERNWVQDNIDDYRFVMNLAKLTNSSFYTSGDTTHFVENIMDTAEASVRLGWGSGLMSFSVDIDISGQVGSVEIAYRTGNREVGYATYDGNDIKGDGQLPSDKGGIISEKSQEHTKTLVDNEKQALIAAKNLFLETAMNYVTGRGSTIGMPDLKAGEAIELEGLGDKLDGKYFLNKVDHQFDAGGYLTSFTCQRPKI